MTFPDGASAFKHVSDSLRLRVSEVKHCNWEFTKELPDGNIAGTQCLDRVWDWCDDYIPRQIKTTDRLQNRTVLNADLVTYFFSLLYHDERFFFVL